MTFVIYIVDLTAADLFFFKLMPTCRCLELSCAVLSLDEKTVIAELHKTDNANPKDVWDCINASYLLDHRCFFQKSEVQLGVEWCFAAS
jgi:hypothetical protein